MTSLLAFFKKLLAATPERPEVIEVRRRLLVWLLTVCVIVGLPPVVLGIVQTLQQGRWGFSLLYSWFYLCFVGGVVFSKRLSLSWQAWALLGPFFAIALASLYRLGLSGVGFTLLLGCSVLGTVLLGFRRGVLLLALSLLAVALVATGMVYGWISLYPQHMLTSTSGLAWSTALFVFLMLSLVLAFAPQLFRFRLEESLALLEEHARRLEESNEQLKEEIAQRQQAEEATRASEEKYRTFIEKAPVAMYTITPQGEFTYGNQRVQQMTGYTLNEWLNKPFHSLIHPDDLHIVQGKVDARRAGGGSPDPYEVRIVHATGDLMWVKIASESIVETNEKGESKLVGIQGFVEDITSRKETEIALRESEERFRELAELLPEALYEMDLTGRLTFVNRAAFKLFGYTEEDLKEGLNGLEMLIPADRERAASYLPLLLEGQEMGHREYTFQRKDGSTFPAILHSTRILQNGKPNGIRGVIIDITQRKEAEEKLRRLSTALEQAAEDIVLTDAEGNIEYVNPAFERITGYSRDEVLGQNPRLLQSGKHDQAFYQKMWRTLLAGQVWSGRLTNKRKDGSLIEQEASISPIWDEGGQLVGYVSVKRDVTEQEKLKARLQQAQKMEAIGTLAGGVAHDFNNILSIILGNLELALHFGLPPDNLAHKRVEQALQAAERASELVQQILAFSRQRDEELYPFEPQPILREAIKLLRASLPSTIEIRQQFKSKGGTILGDPGRLHQVLMNLCTNAAHAMRQQGGLIEVSLTDRTLPDDDIPSHDDLPPGDYIELSVRDTGHGIPPHLLDRIFEPYFTTKEVGEGTGLGLAVVHGIVQSFHGAIFVDSQQGEGSTFRILLPALDGAPPLPPDHPSSFPHGHEQILLVDDEEMITSTVEQILQSLGYSVTTQNNSTAALELFRQQPQRFDLVITDMTMPHLTGDVLSQKLREIRPELPIILCTGYSEQISESKAKALGIRAFLMKPLSIHDLARTLRDALDSP